MSDTANYQDKLEHPTCQYLLWLASLAWASFQYFCLHWKVGCQTGGCRGWPRDSSSPPWLSSFSPWGSTLLRSAPPPSGSRGRYTGGSCGVGREQFRERTELSQWSHPQKVFSLVWSTSSLLRPISVILTRGFLSSTEQSKIFSGLRSRWQIF